MPKDSGTADSIALTETELKLQLDPQQIELLKQRDALTATTGLQADIESIYVDTVDQLLRRNKMALRLRRVNGHWVQTLKTEPGPAGALSERRELEVPARIGVDGAGELDLTRFADSPLGELLSSQSEPQLRPLFRTCVQRTAWMVEKNGAAVEVALDVGEIRVEQSERREAITELELELKHGDRARMLELALALLGAEPPLALIPVARSKATRGYLLAADQLPEAVKAAPKGFVAGLGRKTSTARALRSVMQHGLAILTANTEALLRFDNPEYVHQARVALRRVRSAIRLLDREQQDVPKSITEELRWCAGTLGELRDWDVIADETLPALTETIGAEAAHDLIARADQRRVEARNKIRVAMRSPRYAAFVLNAERWCATAPPARADSLAQVCAPILQSAAKRLFKAARFFAALTPERRHEVRILAKRLRYALDLFAIVLPKAATTRYLDALSGLQDVLGQLNDASVAGAVLPQLSSSVALRKAVGSWMVSIEPGRVHDAEVRLLKLSTLKAPWK